MITIMTSLAAIVSLQAGLPAADSQGLAHLESLYRNREAIESGYLEYSVTWDVRSRDKSLQGAVRTYRVWFDRNRRRLDLREVRPNDPDQALHSRYSFDGKTYRIIDADRPNFCVREYSGQFLAKKSPAAVPQAGPLDPRLIGVVGMEHGHLQHHRLEELKNLAPGETIRVASAQHAGDEATAITVTSPNGKAVTRVIPVGSPLPGKMTTKFADRSPQGERLPEIRVEVESEVASWPNGRGESFSFPRTMTIRRISDGEVESAETIRVAAARFNVPIPAAEFSWKALAPALGAPLVYDDEYMNSTTKAIRWDGAKFATVSVDPIVKAETESEIVASRGDGALLRLASFAAAGVGSASAIILTVQRRNRRRREPS